MAEEWQYAELADKGGLVLKVEGLKELQKALRKFPQEWEEIAGGALKPGMIRVASKAKEKGYVPVDTGILRASIGDEVKGGILDVQKVGSEIVGRVGSKVEYAEYQEYGTRYMVGQYYLTRALKDTKDQVVKMFEEGISKALRRLLG